MGRGAVCWETGQSRGQRNGFPWRLANAVARATALLGQWHIQWPEECFCLDVGQSVGQFFVGGEAGQSDGQRSGSATKRFEHVSRKRLKHVCRCLRKIMVMMMVIAGQLPRLVLAGRHLRRGPRGRSSCGDGHAGGRPGPSSPAQGDGGPREPLRPRRPHALVIVLHDLYVDLDVDDYGRRSPLSVGVAVYSDGHVFCSPTFD